MMPTDGARGSSDRASSPTDSGSVPCPARQCVPAGGKTLVIGLGNPLISDDSVGLRVVEQLRPRLAGDARVDVVEDYLGWVAADGTDDRLRSRDRG